MTVSIQAIPEKPRFDRSEALAVAKELYDALKPACSRLIVAGSLRRRKPAVGEVEILFIPRFEHRQADMFSCESASLAEKAINTLVACSVLTVLRFVGLPFAQPWDRA